jgi:hypothetical protein
MNINALTNERHFPVVISGSSGLDYLAGTKHPGVPLRGRLGVVSRQACRMIAASAYVSFLRVPRFIPVCNSLLS